MTEGFKVVLEAMIAKAGIFTVLQNIMEVCEAEADKNASSTGSQDIVKRWVSNARKVEILLATIDDM